MLWLLLLVAIAAVCLFYIRMNARAERDADNPDAGSAIVEFGRAFPEEAIRALHSTVDRTAIFLRLHDGKAGFIQSHGTHYVCHVIQPGKVRVNTSESGRGLISTSRISPIWTMLSSFGRPPRQPRFRSGCSALSVRNRSWK